MSFTNLQVNLTELPSVDELVMEPMAEAYEKEVKAQQLVIWLPILVLSVQPVIWTQILPLLLIPVLLLMLATIISRLVIKKSQIKAVALREFDIAYRSGLLWRKTVIVAFNRIQHVEVSSGPLQRRFGLASIKLFTAGGSKVDLRIDGLTAERAEQMRTFIAEKIDGSATE